MPNASLRAATYRRVSTEEQVSNHSLGNQADKLAAFAEQQGYAVVRDYVDPGHSGATRKRPGLEQLLHDARLGLFDTVLIYRLDRLARSTHLAYSVIQELMDVGVGVRSSSEPQIDSTTPMGKVSLGVTAIFAELERDTFMQRSQEGREKSLAAGIYNGGSVSYGYEIKDRRLVIQPQEAEVVRMIFQWYLEHRWATVRIAEELTALNIPTRFRGDGRLFRGKETLGCWRGGSIYRMLKSRTYIGEFQYGRRTASGKKDPDRVIKVAVPPIVDLEVWEAAQEMMVTNRVTALRNAKNIYMLKGLIRCAACGRSYLGAKTNGWAGYRCCGRVVPGAGPRHLACKNTHVPARMVEDPVWERITAILLDPGEVLGQQPLTLIPAELPLVEKALADARTSRERLTDLYLDANAGLSKEGYLSRLAGIDAQLAGLEARVLVLRDTQAQRRQQEQSEKRIYDLSAQYRDRLEHADDQLRQTLAHQLVKRITVQTDGSVDIEWVV
ncbi:recombinase family protein [Deinococcus gobiensis]|uniref:DNA recombinase, putative n=1 Tax=Deinococcus gobiensis (strain DSM 21396 / JCM 16679 / CGMCC 1.7299 / I-0) TaxID=745776 RepID=H8H2N3_DEIGI|nr:recombinase family protein [Deinococcus gobiensis]AFD27780.1 DNA recombinase, putative [Deinococcus gobiensis I-0]